MPLFEERRGAASEPVSAAPAQAREDLHRLGPERTGGVGAGRARSAGAGRELWLAVYLPGFMLEALGPAAERLRTGKQAAPAAAAGSSAPASPLAVVDQEQGGRVIRACDARAVAAGIRPGMALNSALALLPTLEILARAEHREQRLLEAAGGWAQTYTPRVSLEPPDALLLEIKGSLRLFGGVGALWQQLRDELRAAGLQPLFALTPVPLASLWFAYAGVETRLRRADGLASRLAPLPLACTRWSERSLQQLETMGVRALGDCLRLPRDGFARRFGPQMLEMLDRATARLPDPRAAFAPHAHYSCSRELEPELADVARIEPVASAMLDELCAFLRRRDRVVQGLVLRFRHRIATDTRLVLRFAQPTAAHEHMVILLHEHLSRLSLPEAVRSLRLRSGPLVAARGEAPGLLCLGRDASWSGAVRLVERLRARLGMDAVQSLSPVPEHRPESAWRVAEPQPPRFRRAGSRAGMPDGAGATAAAGVARPLWLLGEPQALGFESPCFEGRLEFEEGPERIESGWWDGRDVKRDYYVARNPAGVRLWIYRERAAGGGWFLHGIFG
jgi:protein ImuB